MSNWKPHADYSHPNWTSKAPMSARENYYRKRLLLRGPEPITRWRDIAIDAVLAVAAIVALGFIMNIGAFVGL